ncbi:MAG: histidine kinase [Clostridiaceae bacterium]
MDKWIILNKLIILVYSSLKYITLYEERDELTVLFLLLYIAISMLLYISENKNTKIVLGNVISIFLIVSGVYITPLFLFLLPINLFELMYRISVDNIYLNISIIATTILMEKDSRLEYLFISIATYLLFSLLIKSKERIDELMKENDNLKLSYDNMHSKIIKDAEYESQIIYTSKLEERNKIAQEIHDKIGHTLSGSILQLQASKMIMEKDKEKSIALMDNTISVLSEGMESIRVTLRNIKPPFEQVGINKIKLLLEEFTSKSNIKHTFMFQGEIQNVTYRQWKVIEENIKECLTNTIKYSKGNKLTVDLQVFNKIIRTEIKDNGVGSFNFRKGMGLKGIEERCGSMGGRVIVDGSRGFSVVIILPIES